MTFTKLLESYKEKRLKALSEMVIKEEPTEEQFNKEVDTAKKQSEGKIKKKIAEPSVQAVEIQKEEKNSFKKLRERCEEVLIYQQLSETLGKDSSAKQWIDDFIQSDDPRFAGDTKAKRIKRALGAYYKEHPELSKKKSR